MLLTNNPYVMKKKAFEGRKILTFHSVRGRRKRRVFTQDQLFQLRHRRRTLHFWKREHLNVTSDTIMTSNTPTLRRGRGVEDIQQWKSSFHLPSIRKRSVRRFFASFNACNEKRTWKRNNQKQKYGNVKQVRNAKRNSADAWRTDTCSNFL